MRPVTGWVYWQEREQAEPTWKFGTLSELDGALSFEERAARTGDQYWITPGLVDTHNHLSIGETGVEPDTVAIENAAREVAAGVLAIREMGNPAQDRVVTGAGWRFPRMVGAGRHIARPKRYLPGLAIEIEDPSDLPLVVEQQAILGTGWVKLVGDWIDRSGGAEADLDPLWGLSELKEAVGAAHELGARVAVHTFGTKALGDLLEAGVDSIEHGSGMLREHAQEAAAKGIPVTPTLGQVELFPDFAAGAHRYPVYAKTMMRLFENRHDWFATLQEESVQLLPGTDAGGYQPHAQVYPELLRWQEAGMDASTIVELATWKAREFLGFPSLKPGDPADFLVLDRDPTLDLHALGSPRRIVLGGKVV